MFKIICDKCGETYSSTSIDEIMEWDNAHETSCSGKKVNDDQ